MLLIAVLLPYLGTLEPVAVGSFRCNVDTVTDMDRSVKLMVLCGNTRGMHLPVPAPGHTGLGDRQTQ